MRSRNNLKDVAKKAMKCMSKQVTPILDRQAGTAEVCLGEEKANKSTLFISQGQSSKSAVTDICFLESDHL